MTAPVDQSTVARGRIVVSVDAMGGDQGPAAVVAGVSRSAHKNPDIGFILHGQKEVLEPLVAKRALWGRCEIRHAPDMWSRWRTSQRMFCEMVAKPRCGRPWIRCATARPRFVSLAGTPAH